jgi:hypothetical protein
MPNSQSPPLDTVNDPSREPLSNPTPFQAPAAVGRPRNGLAGPNDPLGIDANRDHTGGGRAPGAFCPEFCKPSGK